MFGGYGSLRRYHDDARLAIAVNGFAFIPFWRCIAGCRQNARGRTILVKGTESSGDSLMRFVLNGGGRDRRCLYSRRINLQHWLVYQVLNPCKIVKILQLSKSCSINQVQQRVDSGRDDTVILTNKHQSEIIK